MSTILYKPLLLSSSPSSSDLSAGRKERKRSHEKSSETSSGRDVSSFDGPLLITKRLRHYPSKRTVVIKRKYSIDNFKMPSGKNGEGKLIMDELTFKAIQNEVNGLSYPLSVCSLANNLADSSSILFHYRNSCTSANDHEDDHIQDAAPPLTRKFNSLRITKQIKYCPQGGLYSQSQNQNQNHGNMRQQEWKHAMSQLISTDESSFKVDLKDSEEAILHLRHVLSLPNDHLDDQNREKESHDNDHDHDHDNDHNSQNRNNNDNAHFTITTDLDKDKHKHRPLLPMSFRSFSKQRIIKKKNKLTKTNIKTNKNAKSMQYQDYLKTILDVFGKKGIPYFDKLNQLKQTPIPPKIIHPKDHQEDKQQQQPLLSSTEQTNLIHDTKALPLPNQTCHHRMEELLSQRITDQERKARRKQKLIQDQIEAKIKQQEQQLKVQQQSKNRADTILRPLTSKEHDIVNNAIHGKGPPNQILASSDTDTVQRASLHKLQPGQWLNDEIIHYFYLMLANRDEYLCNNQPGKKRSHFFKSFFLTKLFDEGATDQYKYTNVKRWSKRVPGKDIFNLSKIFFPCNIGNTHWACAVIFMEDKIIQFYDSMGGSGKHYMNGLFSYLKDEWKAKKGGEMPDEQQWKLIPTTSDTPCQQNGYDCGVFTCMFADFLALDFPLTFSQKHIHLCRERIALSIMNGIAIH